MPATVTLHHPHNADAIRAIVTIDVAVSGTEQIQSTMTLEQLLAEKIIKEVADAIQPGWVTQEETNENGVGPVPQAERSGRQHPQGRDQALE